MTEVCGCEVSFLTRAQPGQVVCTVCALPWTDNKLRPIVLDSERAALLTSFLMAGGLAALVARLDTIVYVQPGNVVEAPGKASLLPCPDCDYFARLGRHCDCNGTGVQVFCGCIRCGDIGAWTWTDERQTEARCSRCGEQWNIGHPAWLAQSVPDRLLAKAV